MGPADDVNAKVRQGSVEVKRLIDLESGFQRWQPEWSADLPIKASTVIRLFQELGASTPALSGTSVDESQLGGLVDADPELYKAEVVKRRRFYSVDGVLAETTLTRFEPTKQFVPTVVIEGPDLDDLEPLLSDLSMDEADNTPMNEAVAMTMQGKAI